MSDGWQVAQVTSGQEGRFCRAASGRWGPEAVWCPEYNLTVFHRRRRTWYKTRRVMLPGYVLLRPSHAVSDALLKNMTDGVWAALLRNQDGQPLHVSPRDAEVLQQAEQEVERDSDPRTYALQFARGSLHVVRQGLMVGTEVEVARSCRRGDSNGRFQLGTRIFTIPLYLFAEPSYA